MTSGNHDRPVRAIVRAVEQASPGLPVLVGGAGISDEEHAARLGAVWSGGGTRRLSEVIDDLDRRSRLSSRPAAHRGRARHRRGPATRSGSRPSTRLGARSLTVSGIAVSVGALVTLGALRTETWGRVVLIAAVGVDLGLFSSPNNASIMGAAPGEQAGMASGILNMTRGMRRALGLAVAGTVFAVAGGDSGVRGEAAHVFTVTCFTLAGVALASMVAAGLDRAVRWPRPGRRRWSSRSGRTTCSDAPPVRGSALHRVRAIHPASRVSTVTIDEP